jgi:hypothetical protein
MTTVPQPDRKTGLSAAASAVARVAARVASAAGWLWRKLRRAAAGASRAWSAVRTFGPVAVSRAVLAGPLFRVRQLLTRVRLRPMSLSMVAALGAAALAASPALRRNLTAIAVTIAGRAVRGWRWASERLTGLVKTFAGGWRSAANQAGHSMRLLADRTGLSGAAVGRFGVAGLVPLLALLLLGSRPVLAAAGGLPLIGLWRSTRKAPSDAMHSQQDVIRPTVATEGPERLAGEEVFAVYGAMLTLHDAVPEAARLIGQLTQSSDRAGRRRAESLLDDCERTVTHLAELTTEVHRQDGTDTLLVRLAGDIDELLAGICPQLADCRAQLASLSDTGAPVIPINSRAHRPHRGTAGKRTRKPNRARRR